MKTLAMKFKEKAAELMPHMDDLQDLPDSMDSSNAIDEIMFRKSEYLGGMAAVILELCCREQANQ